MTVATGSRVLDAVLNGGLPDQRAVLLTGGPGTGKSTLAMQFLQQGLANGDRCLFISTEQTGAELRDSFDSFDFDLDHDHLAVTTIHATPGRTLDSESDDEQLTLQTLEGGELLGEGYSPAFTGHYIEEYLSTYAPRDRVVIDSVSGIASLADTDDLYRRAVLDLIRLFSDEFEATTLMTAEHTGTANPGATTAIETTATSDAVQFNAHGVIRLWREQIEGGYHRFLGVTKMRGVNHDTRPYEIEFTDAGLRLLPRLRSHPSEFIPDEFIGTNIDGLDTLMGGGIVEGGAALLEYDGQASPHALLANLLAEARANDMALVFTPSVELPPKLLADIFAERVGPMRDLLDENNLFLIDMVNVWENHHRNVFKPRAANGDLREVFETIDDRRGDQPLFSFVNVESCLPNLSTDDLRRVRFWEEENFYRDEDTALYFYNPASMPDKLEAFYKNGAWQVLRLWMHTNGLQYITIDKTPSGFMGMTRALEYVPDPPYMRVQHPPTDTRLDGEASEHD